MNKAALLAILGGLVVASAIILNYVTDTSDQESPTAIKPLTPKRVAMTAPQVSTPQISAPQIPAPQIPAPLVVPNRIESLQVEASQNTAPADKAAKPGKINKPDFDVVRVNRQGDAVMAGRALPGNKVVILDGDKKIGTVTADKRGEWVFVPKKPLAPGSRQLSLKMINKSGKVVHSVSKIILVVPEKGKDIGGRKSKRQEQPLVMKVPAAGPGPVAVLQTPTPITVDEAKSEGASLTVDAIDYDAKGNLSIVGKAVPDTQVNLYLDNKFIGRGFANDDGVWRQSPSKPVADGNYLLRADQVAKDGKVKARVEVHFSRSVPLKDVKPGSQVVVLPGNSLWRIARHTYGAGIRYTVIYNANKKQIRNADLIFPGQVFTLPPN